MCKFIIVIALLSILQRTKDSLKNTEIAVVSDVTNYLVTNQINV